MMLLQTLFAVVLLAIAAASASAQTTESSAREAFRDDVHAAAKLRCEACHPNGPSYALARTAIAPLCARCHSDAAYMKGFDPQVRVDQYTQYLTSTHGKRMAAGETRVATCSDCHGAHGIRRIRDSRAPVAPANVAQTCAKCHADSTRMAAFKRDTAPYADWSGSVHAAALLKRGDLSAPTCSTCHGSHGATPPGITQVSNVCAQCHAREAELFRASAKKAIFEQIGQPECLACHSNHRIVHPEDAWVGLKDPAVCAICHDDKTKGAQTILEIRRGLDDLTAGIEAGQVVLARAERVGMLVDDGKTALREARDHQIHSRVLVHAFATKPFAELSNQGLTAARRSKEIGESALRELRIRRWGLLAATVLVLGFLVTLWVKMQRLPPPTTGED